MQRINRVLTSMETSISQFNTGVCLKDLSIPGAFSLTASNLPVSVSSDLGQKDPVTSAVGLLLSGS